MGISFNANLGSITNSTFISGTSTAIGLFLDDFGNPLQSPTVIAFPILDTSLSTPLFQGAVNNDGSFNINVPMAGTYQVQLTGGGLSKVRTVFFSDLPVVTISGLSPVTESTLDVSNVALGPVLTPGGIPIIGAEVVLFSGNDLTFSTPMSDPAFTGGDGTFRVYGVPGNNFQVVFQATGFKRNIRNVII